MAKKKRARRQSKKAGVNRSQLIRDFLTKKPKATNREVKQALADQGVEVSDNLISSARRSVGIAATRSRKGRVKKSPVRSSKSLTSRDDSVSVTSLLAAQKFAAEVGGVEPARRLLDVLSKIQK